MITVGMDLGTQRIKALLLKDGIVGGRGEAFSGFNPTEAAKQAVDKALKTASLHLSDVAGFVATGSNMEIAPYANSTISMMGADAKAATHLFPRARTIIDVGAEEALAVKVDERGGMVDFIVNERCAAGAGTFIEAMARALEVKMQDMGPLSLKAERASQINASCVVFGESDVVSLIHRQEPKAQIARAIYDAMADRISSMVHRLGVNPDVVLLGGMARDIGFETALDRKLGIKVLIPQFPDFAGALGAALIAVGRVKVRA